jgi:hypothetical protein
LHLPPISIKLFPTPSTGGKMETLLAVLVITFLVNLPFGWLREGVKKFSPKWFIYVHFPIPFIVALRITLGIEWKFAPLLIFTAILGQWFGARMRRNQTALEG